MFTTRGIFTSVNKSLVKSHLSCSSQNDLICPKGKQKCNFFPLKKLQTSGAPWMSCGVFLLQVWLRGKRSRLRHRFPCPLCMFFFIHPQKRVKPGDGWRLDVFLPVEHPLRVLSQCLHPAPLLGSPWSGNVCSVLFTRDSAQIWIPVPPNPAGAAGAVSEVSPPVTQVSPAVIPGPSAGMGSNSDDI